MTSFSHTKCTVLLPLQIAANSTQSKGSSRLHFVHGVVSHFSNSGVIGLLPDLSNKVGHLWVTIPEQILSIVSWMPLH